MTTVDYFVLIGDLTMDSDDNVYVTDKLLGRITKFDSKGLFQQSIGQADRSIHHFVRPKGIDVDQAGRIWVVDAAPEVAKVYNPEWQLLLYFGFPGNKPGSMNLPASILIDYDHVELFRQYMVSLGMIQEHETFVDFYTHIKGVEYIISVAFLSAFPAFFNVVNKTKAPVAVSD